MIERNDLAEQLGDLAETLRAQYPAVAGILFSLAATVQLQDGAMENEMLSHTDVFTKRVMCVIKQRMEDCDRDN